MVSSGRVTRASPIATTKSGALRAFLAVVALLVTGTHLSAVLHFALVSHGICADHGEMIHAGESHDSTSAEGTEAALDVPPDATDAHEHCRFVAKLREQVTARNDASIDLPVLTGLEPAFAPRVVVPTARDILLVAPKQSPPV
jgi:hypothetical protein